MRSMVVGVCVSGSYHIDIFSRPHATLQFFPTFCLANGVVLSCAAEQPTNIYNQLPSLASHYFGDAGERLFKETERPRFLLGCDEESVLEVWGYERMPEAWDALHVPRSLGFRVQCSWIQHLILRHPGVV